MFAMAAWRKRRFFVSGHKLINFVRADHCLPVTKSATLNWHLQRERKMKIDDMPEPPKNPDPETQLLINKLRDNPSFLKASIDRGIKEGFEIPEYLLAWHRNNLH